MSQKQFLGNVISKIKYYFSLKDEITVKHPVESFALHNQTLSVVTAVTAQARVLLMFLCMGQA